MGVMGCGDGGVEECVPVIGITVGNFNHVNHLTFHRVFNTRNCSMMTVGSLAGPSVLTGLLGCSATRNNCYNCVNRGLRAMTTSSRTNAVAISNGALGVCTRGSTGSLP